MREAFKIIRARELEHKRTFVADHLRHPIAHSTDDIEELKRIQYNAVRAGRVADGVGYQTLDEAKKRMTSFVTDGFWNPLAGVGSYDDPGMYAFAYVPVTMSPQEATAYYSSGGIPQVIIDKKAKGVMTEGYGFEGDGWQPDEIKRLHDYGEQTGYGDAIANAIRDGLIYGGSVLYPQMYQDDARTLEMNVEGMLAAGVLKLNSISHWVATDRWNCVMVPNWNVTAKDYLFPSHYYVPLGGVKVATARSAVVRPRMLPYWGMLPQMGWGISDYEGYVPSILAYQILIASIPIMAQQMSLLFHELPLDATIAMNGIDDLKEFIAHNDDAMRTWSMTHPRTVNTIGKIGAVERSYQNFDQLAKLLREDIGARSEMPESVIFFSQAGGFQDSKDEGNLLKQAQAVRKIAVAVGPQLKATARILAMSCFGPEYFQGEVGKRKLRTLALTFDPPEVETPAQRAESGAKFATTFNQLVGSNLPVDIAMKLTLIFFPKVEIPKDIMERLEGTFTEAGAGTLPEVREMLLKNADLLVDKLTGGAGNGGGELRAMLERNAPLLVEKLKEGLSEEGEEDES